ncbi:hypothetical protein SNE40_018227 [Patella caerulea]|uniref:Uncharacterized protein n=1 Tax=Patella caerulea TaxID=87958 RepID=A0AAN8JBE8_PATCE
MFGRIHEGDFVQSKCDNWSATCFLSANDVCGVTERPVEARTLNPQLRKDVVWIKDAMFDTHLLSNDTQQKLLQSQRHFSRYNCTLQNRGYQNSGGRYSSDRSWSPFPNLYVHPCQHSCRKFARSSGQSSQSQSRFSPNFLSRKLPRNSLDSVGDAAAQRRFSSTTTHDQHIQSPSASGNELVPMQQMETLPSSEVSGAADIQAMFDSQQSMMRHDTRFIQQNIFTPQHPFSRFSSQVPKHWYENSGDHSSSQDARDTFD